MTAAIAADERPNAAEGAGASVGAATGEPVGTVTGATGATGATVGAVTGATGATGAASPEGAMDGMSEGMSLGAKVSAISATCKAVMAPRVSATTKRSDFGDKAISPCTVNPTG